MNAQIDKIKKFRLHLLKQIEGLTTQELNNIPTGYNNNIIWNLGHLLSAEQNVCYVRSGLPTTIDEKIFSTYLSGTKPERFIEEQEIKSIKELLISSMDKLQSDLDNNIFKTYSPSVMIPKVYGFEINNIHDAVEYLLYHEGFHSGYVLSLKHML